MKAILALAALLLAAPVSADLWSHGCVVTNDTCSAANVPYDCCTGANAGTCPSSDAITGVNNIGSGSQDKFTIRALERACWWVENADGAARNSLSFRATSDFRVCVNDDLLAAPGDTLFEVSLIGCPDSGRPGTNPLNVCNNVTLGPSDTCTLLDRTVAATSMEPGMYFIDITVACVAGDRCQVSIEGVDPQRQ